MSAHLYREPARGLSWSLPIPRWLVAMRQRREQQLDPATLSDHLQRDLGLLGGRTAPPRDILRD